MKVLGINLGSFGISFFFLPWDYWITFLLSFSSLQTLPSLLFFKFMASFLLHAWMCMQIFLDITCLVHITLIVCMFSGLIIGKGQPIGVFLLGEGHLSFAQLPSVAQSSCVGLRAWAFLHSVWHVPWFHLCSAHAWASRCLLWDCLLVIRGKFSLNTQLFLQTLFISFPKY